LTDYQRLNDAVLSNRIDQLLQRFASKILPRLQRARHNPCQVNLMHSLARLGDVGGRGNGRCTNQRTKTFTKSRTCHASEATGTALSRQTAIRAQDILRLAGAASSLAKEFLKKVLTLNAEIQYQCARHQNRKRTLPGRFFVCLESSDLTNQNKHITGKEK